MAKGRPPVSVIRSNIAEILYFVDKAHGYDIFKFYSEIFPLVTMRSIYYQLRRGVQLNEFKVYGVKVEEGYYSWGSHAQKTYFCLGSAAAPKGLLRVKKIIDKSRKKDKALGNDDKPKAD